MDDRSNVHVVSAPSKQPWRITFPGGGTTRPVYTSEADWIFNELLPRWADLFLEKNLKYKDVPQDLGPRGVFPDINRKVGILKTRIWNSETTPGEGTKEVISDTIGHLFLMWALLEAEEARKSD